MKSDPKAALMRILAGHIGRGNGVNVKRLASLTALNARTVRVHVSALREDGHAICGTPRDGYYIAATAEELEETCQFIRARAMHSLTIESRLKKIPLSDLIGQLHLPT
jgi:DNA-binding transcriptional ArsR family regulator